MDTPEAYRTQLLQHAPAPLWLHHWPASGPQRAQLLVVHGYLEHGGRYAALAGYAAARGIATYAVDLRGHGRSAGPRGYIAAFADYHADVRAARSTLPQAGPTFLLGHSNGGLVALQLALAQAGAYAGLCLINPYLAMARPPPPLKALAGRIAGRIYPRLALPAGITAADLSSAPAAQAAHAADPLIFTRATAGWFREVRRAQEQLQGPHKLGLPLLFVYSDADPVASPVANRRAAATLQAADKTVLLRAGERHEPLHEAGRESLFAAITAWLLQRCEGETKPVQ